MFTPHCKDGAKIAEKSLLKLQGVFTDYSAFKGSGRCRTDEDRRDHKLSGAAAGMGTMGKARLADMALVVGSDVEPVIISSFWRPHGVAVARVMKRGTAAHSAFRLW